MFSKKPSYMGYIPSRMQFKYREVYDVVEPTYIREKLIYKFKNNVEEAFINNKLNNLGKDGIIDELENMLGIYYRRSLDEKDKIMHDTLSGFVTYLYKIIDDINNDMDVIFFNKQIFYA